MSDIEFLSVSFEFEGGNYYSLIRKKRKGNVIQYCITIMNGELERLLYGNHIITEIDGMLQLEKVVEDPRRAALKQAVTKALQRYLHVAKETQNMSL